jgi:uncharacterized protein (TIGR03083 family)
VSHAGIAGMRSAAGDLVDIGRGLHDTEWQTPSAAAGWSVRDVISHVGCLLELLQAAVRGEALPDTRIEPLNDVMVAERRGWDNTRTLENVQKQLEQAIAMFIPLQDEPMASVEAPMLDLGTYPLHAIADMFTFDMTTHLRCDILAPRGPITRQLPPLDEVRLGPSVSWLLGGIPKMQAGLARHLGRHHHRQATIVIRPTGRDTDLYHRRLSRMVNHALTVARPSGRRRRPECGR